MAVVADSILLDEFTTGTVVTQSMMEDLIDSKVNVLNPPSLLELSPSVITYTDPTTGIIMNCISYGNMVTIHFSGTLLIDLPTSGYTTIATGSDLGITIDNCGYIFFGATQANGTLAGYDIHVEAGEINIYNEYNQVVTGMTLGHTITFVCLN